MPLASLDPVTFGKIVLMLVAMQCINEGGIVALVRARGQPARSSLSLFDTVTELMAGLAAILVAIVWTRMEMAVFVLLLSVLAALMLALKRFAEMRLKLERLVEERTAALREKTLQLEQLAAQDKLTGLHNRRHADEFLRREFEHAERQGGALAIALADIDHFKEINDGRSHSVGDRVLERLARIFKERTRESDLVARYGGEEFLFCFVGMDEPDAAQRLRRPAPRRRARGLGRDLARHARDHERRRRGPRRGPRPAGLAQPRRHPPVPRQAARPQSRRGRALCRLSSGPSTSRRSCPCSAP